MNVIIYGAGEAGIITKRTLDRDAAIKYKVTGFIDDDEKNTAAARKECLFMRHQNCPNLSVKVEPNLWSYPFKNIKP